MNATMELGLWGRRYPIVVRDAVIQGEVAMPVQYPENSCSGWGYQCCDEITQVPGGVLVAGVANDCRNSCYSACTSRPLVLSFRSDPQQESGATAVNLTADNAELAFAAVVSAPGAALQKVVIEFGDGSN